MKTIPKEFAITEPYHQKSYLIDGELLQWDGPTSEVISTISSTEDYQQTVLGSIPLIKDKGPGRP